MISDDLDSCQPHLYCDTLSPTPLCMLQPVTTMIESDQIRADTGVAPQVSLQIITFCFFDVNRLISISPTPHPTSAK